MSALYRELRLQHLTKNPRCKVCGKPSSQIHHKAGRVGKKLVDTKDFLAVCFECHEKIHHNPAWAYAKDYLIRTAPALAKPTQYAGIPVGLPIPSR